MEGRHETPRYQPSWEPEPLPLPIDDPRCRERDRRRRDDTPREDLPGSHVVVIDLA